MPLARQEFNGFLGVNLRKDRTTLEDTEMARAINADLHSQVGTAVVRLPKTKLFATALTDEVVRRLARINSHRYQVAGRSVYRDQVRVGDADALSANLMTTLTPFRPLNDLTTWAFVADDVIMQKASPTVMYRWGIAAPTEPTVIQVGAIGGTLSGDYTAVYTYIRFDDTKVAHESNPSPVPDAITLSGQQLVIQIHESPDPQVNGFGIYRTVANGVSQLLDARVAIPTEATTLTAAAAISATFPWEAASVAVLVFKWSLDIGAMQGTQRWEPNETTSSEDARGFRGTYLWEKTFGYVTTQARQWSYASSIIDSALGTQVELDNDPPPLAAWGTEYQGHMTLCRDAANPHYLWFSKRFRPESVPPDNFLEIGNPDDPLQCAVRLSGLLAVLTRRTKYRVVGSSASGFVAQEALSARGTPSPNAALATERGLVFVARDGVYLTNVIAEDQEISATIAPLFFNESANGFDPINWDAALTMAAAYYKGRYYLSLPTGTATTPDLLAVYSTTTTRWYFFDHPARSLYSEEDTDSLLGGFTDGFVYVLEDADGLAEATSIDWQTKDGFAGSLAVRKLFQWAKVDVDALGDTVTVELYVDGILKRRTTVTGTRRKILIGFPEKSMGYTWRIRLTYIGTKRVRWYGAEVLALPLEAA